MTTHEFPLRIDAAHPSLPGHFPGHPIVPGVVLLDRVIGAAEACLTYSIRVASLQQAKFTSALLPEQDASILLTFGDGELRFEILRSAERIAQGTFKLAAEHSR